MILREIIDDLRSDYGYTVDMIVRAVGAENAQQLFNWTMGGQGLEEGSIEKLHHLRVRLRQDRKHAQERRTPSRRSDQKKVVGKRSLKRERVEGRAEVRAAMDQAIEARDAREASQTLPQTSTAEPAASLTEPPAASPAEPPAEPPAEEESVTTSEPTISPKRTRPLKDSVSGVAAIQFAREALNISKPQLSRLYGDPTGRRIGNWLYGIDRGGALSDAAIEAVEQITKQVFGLSPQEPMSLDASNYQHMAAQYEYLEGGVRKADGSTQKKPRAAAPNAPPDRKRHMSQAGKEAGKEAEPTKETNGVASPPAAALMDDETGQMQKLTHFDDKIERVRELLIQATTEARECREVAPHFGGIRKQILELETWLGDTVKQYWPAPEDIADGSSSD